MDKKRVSVFVAGQRFNIITDEEEKYVIDIAAKIDARITSLTISQNIPRERAAVLTALDYADDNEQDKRAIAEIKEQIKDYLTQISLLSEKNTALNAENDQLRRTIAAMDEEQSAKEASMKDNADRITAQEKEKDALNGQIMDLKEQMSQMNNENHQLRHEIAALKEEQLAKEASIKDAEDRLAAENKEKEALKAQIRALKEQMDLISTESTPVQEAPAEKNTVTSDDDLFFDTQEEPAPKPLQKEKKNRHDHSHVNPYKQQFMNKKNEQKGYTQQRQYSLFDTDE